MRGIEEGSGSFLKKRTKKLLVIWAKGVLKTASSPDLIGRSTPWFKKHIVRKKAWMAGSSPAMTSLKAGESKATIFVFSGKSWMAAFAAMTWEVRG
jgi:hypothetical protein